MGYWNDANKRTMGINSNYARGNTASPDLLAQYQSGSPAQRTLLLQNNGTGTQLRRGLGMNYGDFLGALKGDEATAEQQRGNMMAGMPAGAGGMQAGAFSGGGAGVQPASPQNMMLAAALRNGAPSMGGQGMGESLGGMGGRMYAGGSRDFNEGAQGLGGSAMAGGGMGASLGGSMAGNKPLIGGSMPSYDPGASMGGVGGQFNPAMPNFGQAAPNFDPNGQMGFAGGQVQPGGQYAGMNDTLYPPTRYGIPNARRQF